KKEWNSSGSRVCAQSRYGSMRRGLRSSSFLHCVAILVFPFRRGLVPQPVQDWRWRDRHGRKLVNEVARKKLAVSGVVEQPRIEVCGIAEPLADETPGFHRSWTALSAAGDEILRELEPQHLPCRAVDWEMHPGDGAVDGDAGRLSHQLLAQQ